MDAMERTPPVTLGSNLLRPRQRSLARRWVIIVSMIAHVGAIGAYVVVGMLRVERITPDRGHISVAMGMKMPDMSGGGEPGHKPKDPPKPKTDKPKIKVETLVQPTTDTTKVSTEGQTLTTPGTDTGKVGTGIPGIGTEPKPPGDCVGDQCDQTPTTDPVVPKPVVKKTTKELTPGAMKALRVTSDDEAQIQPGDNTKTTMQREGKAKTQAIVRVCIDTSGRVSSTSLLKSSGYPDYDSRLVSGTKRWEYQAAKGDDGQPISACSQVFFTFVLK